jgi:hypothetical protein
VSVGELGCEEGQDASATRIPLSRKIISAPKEISSLPKDIYLLFLYHLQQQVKYPDDFGGMGVRAVCIF